VKVMERKGSAGERGCLNTSLLGFNNYTSSHGSAQETTGINGRGSVTQTNEIEGLAYARVRCTACRSPKSPRDPESYDQHRFKFQEEAMSSQGGVAVTTITIPQHGYSRLVCLVVLAR
jgi:hypothetical protein